MGLSGLRRGQSRLTGIPELGDLPDRSGGVMGGDRFPALFKQKLLGLSERLRMAANGLDCVQRARLQTKQDVAHLYDVFGDDRRRRLNQAVEDGQDTAGGGVLDRQYQAIHLLVHQSVEGRGETGKPDAFGVRQQVPGRGIAVRTRLSLVAGLHRRHVRRVTSPLPAKRTPAS